MSIRTQLYARLGQRWWIPHRPPSLRSAHSREVLEASGRSFSSHRLFVTPWTVACQAPPSMGFSRQEYWSGVPLPSPLIGPTTCNFNFQPIIFKYLLSLVFC